MADNIELSSDGIKSYLPILNWLLYYQRGWQSDNLLATVTYPTTLMLHSEAKHFPSNNYVLSMVGLSSFLGLWLISLLAQLDFGETMSRFMGIQIGTNP